MKTKYNLTDTELQHFKTHQSTLKAYLDAGISLLWSDVTRPVFVAFERETKSSVDGCKDCKLDAIRWALARLKETDEEAVNVEVIKSKKKK
jgi:RNase P/RNase MRP subunit POP5